MKDQQMYLAPECEEIIIAPEGVIATSGLQAPGFNDGGDLDELFN